MGLSSSISISTSQIDPTSMLPAPTRQQDPSSDSSSDSFDRHLEDASRSDDSAGARAADRRDEANRRDRTQNASDDEKSNASAAPAGDANTQTADATAQPAVTILQAPAAQATDAKADAPAAKDAKAGKTDKTATASAAATDTQPAVAQPVDAKDAVASTDGASTAKAKIADANTSKTDEQDAKPDDKKEAAILPQAVVVPTAAAPAAPVKTKTASLDAGKAPAAPVLPTDAPLAAPQEAAGDQKAQPDAATGANSDPDAGLTIKATKEGLGHEAAAQMADKTSGKDAPQTAAQTVQAAAPAAPAPTSFAAKTAQAPVEAGVQGISSTASTDNTGAARLTDLQNVAGNQNQNSTTATVRIGTLPGQTQPTQVPSMTIALQIARNLQKGVNRFDIRLDPAEMGRIDVRMEVSRDGTVAAHLTVDRPETLNLLQRDAGSLQQALSDAGLQANADSLNFSLRDQNAGGNAQNFSAGGTGTSPLGGGGSGAEETTMTPVYNVNLSATGGVDIRV